MTYLVDTDWIASFLNGRQEAYALFQQLTFPEMAISLITYGEIYDGIYHGRHPRVAEQAFQQLLRGLTVLSLNRSIMRRFAQIRGDLRSAGNIFGDPDILNGATALHHNLAFVTRNLKDYRRIPDLTIYQYP
jgi:predicted nucleic acid-binding protein